MKKRPLGGSNPPLRKGIRFAISAKLSLFGGVPRYIMRLHSSAIVACCLFALSFGVGLLRADCSLTSTGHTPINDLGPGMYQGFQGALYPNGLNQRPSFHEDAGLALAQQIQPLDLNGDPDPANGRIILLSIGMSNTRQEFFSGAVNGDPSLAFLPRANADPSKNPRVDILNGAQSGRDAAAWADPDTDAWKAILNNLANSGRSPLQIQVVWLKQARARPADLDGFPLHAEALRDDLRAIVQNIIHHFPNCRIVYISPRTRSYALNHEVALNPEPYAYESGFSVKWLIEEQLSGALNYDPAAGLVEAPWLSWGPYLWVDGFNPRSDGLTWLCSDLRSDFTHPADGGVEKVASQLLAFFKTDPTATSWFLRSTVVGLPPVVSPRADVSAGDSPLTVNFSANAVDPDGEIVEYLWTFDDGGFSEEENPTKVFPVPGVHRIRLTVTDDGGNAETGEVTVAVGGADATPPPVRLSVISVADAVRLRIEGTPGTPFVLETSTDLTQWIALGSNVLGIYPLDLSLPADPLDSHGFFRLREGERPCYDCTQVIGYSQVGANSGGWYVRGGIFESIVGDDRWQLLWNSGGGVDKWKNPDYPGWNNSLVSPCAGESDAPDRVILSISGSYGANENAWAAAIDETIETIRGKIPNVQRIVLQAVVGGPDREPCYTDDGMLIRASWQHAHIDNAIATVVAARFGTEPEVVPGFSPMVRTCDDYSDGLGHLTAAGAVAAGQTIAEYYYAIDGQCP